MDTRTRNTWAVFVVGALAVLAALWILTDRGPEPGVADADGQLAITIEDYQFSVDEWRLPAEEPLTLTVVNRDEASHPLSFGREVIQDDLLRNVGYEEDLFEGLDLRVTPAAALVEPEPPDRSTTVQIPPLGTVTIEVTLPADRVGTWNSGCFLARGCHFAAGLSATVHVEP